MDWETAQDLTDEAYLAFYRERLADRDAVIPLDPDARLWCP
jgi:hypothetical protein